MGPPIDLCQAVPGYPPHPGLLEHTAAAAREPAAAKYGAIDGDPALREAYAAEVGVGPDHVAITAGCNQAFFTSLLTIARAGDSILLPTPWFWNHEQSCTMLGIEPRPLACLAANGFVPNPEQAERLIDHRTRAIVLISPNNPTGAVTPPDIIAGFHDLCRRRNVWLILDETYRDFLPAGQGRAHTVFDDPAWPASVIGLYSFSKAYCIPGHRLGAVTAAPTTMQNMMKVLDCLHICPNRAAQSGLAWAIDALREWRASNRLLIQEREAAFCKAFRELPEWQIDSVGAYFAYVRHPFNGETSASVAEQLTRQAGAICLPGSAFGPQQEQYVRLAFANASLEQIHDLPRRLSIMTARQAAAG